MQVGTGRSILNGIAIGKLKIYKKKDTVISTAEIADTAAEVARFEAAQQKAIEQQTALYEKALAEAGEDLAEVFNIHAMMLEDDDFVDAIKEIINGHRGAELHAGDRVQVLGIGSGEIDGHGSLAVEAEGAQTRPSRASALRRWPRCRASRRL